jgi:hypothetical protein
MALLVFFAAATGAFFVAPDFAPLASIIKPALGFGSDNAIGAGAGGPMVRIPVRAFLSNDHGSSQESVERRRCRSGRLGDPLAVGRGHSGKHNLDGGRDAGHRSLDLRLADLAGEMAGPCVLQHLG